MHRFKNILYVSRGIATHTDGLRRAIKMAHINKVPLKILVITPELPVNMEEFKTKNESYIKEEMHSNIAQISQKIDIPESDLTIFIEIETDKLPSTRIIQHVLKNNHDIIIKEADYPDKKGGLKAIDMDLLRKCPCPVWLCRPTGQPYDGAKVAVAIDPTIEDEAGRALSIRMLELAGSLAKRRNSDLHIVSCWDYEFEEYMRRNPWVRVEEEEIKKAVSDTEKAHKGSLESLLGAINELPVKQNIAHVRGRPEVKIPEFVSENNIDILVMGTVARTGIPGFIIGNTAENIIQSVHCSVMAFKPEGFVSPVKLKK